MKLENLKAIGLKVKRTREENTKLLLRRIGGFFLYLSVLVASFTILIVVSINQKLIANTVTIPGLGNVGSFVPPLVLEVINALNPIVLRAITKLEKWDSGQTQFNLVLFRIYVASTLNVLVLAFSYLLLADPFLLASYPTFRSNLVIPTNTGYSCTLDQAADGLFTLFVITFIVRLAMIVAKPIGFYILSVIRSKDWVKEEIDIAHQTVKMLRYYGVIFIAAPFSPLILIFAPVGAYIVFKWEKYFIKKLYAKPKRSWKPHRANYIITLFYAITITVTMLGISAYLFLVPTYAKTCSIQDDYPHLCKYGYLNLSNTTCTTDSSNKYYSLYKDNYPAVICDNACGAFINDYSMLSSFLSYIATIEFLNVIYQILFVYPYFPWAVIIFLSIFIAMIRNDSYVLKLTAFNREKGFEMQITSIKAVNIYYIYNHTIYYIN